jgi:N-acetylmuramoyl-L-alanine amidase
MNFKKVLIAAAAAVGLATVGAGVATGQTAQASINSQAKQYKYSGVTYLFEMLKSQGIKYNCFWKSNKIRYRYGKPEGIVIHETATPGASAYNEAIYFNRAWGQMYSYVHAFVDHNQVIQMMTPNYGVWGAGPAANNRFVQVELCEESNSANFAKSVNNDAIYAAYILHRYGLKPNDAAYDGRGTVWSHHSVSRYLGGTDHTDPDGYFAKHGYSMAQFYQLIKYYYNKNYTNQNSNENNNNNNNSTQPAKPAVKKTILHNSFVYNSKHKRVIKKVYHMGDTVKTYGTITINGENFYAIGDGHYIDAGNIDGEEKTLTKNSAVYDKRRRKTNSSMSAGQNVTVFGDAVKLGRKSYYIVGINKYIPTSAFN